MRKLVLLRGIQGSGKSTFIKENGLKNYSLSPDSIRVLFQSPVLNEAGKWTNSHHYEVAVWKLLKELVESRMKIGEFTVIDATHTRSRDFKLYKELIEKYQYKVFCVDFSDVGLETALERNRYREEHRIVPEEVIREKHRVINLSPIPEWIEVVKPKEFKKKVYEGVNDLNRYEKIHHIGDIHGCYDSIKSYMDAYYKENEFYIFTGDYIDRGPNSVETIQYLMRFMDKENVVFLQGNHDRSLKDWALDLETTNQQFKEVTKKEFDESNLKKEDVLAFFKSLKEFIRYFFQEKDVIVTHGGLSRLPTFPDLCGSRMLINGVGNYDTLIDELFTMQTRKHQYQVHGHRNKQMLPIQAAERSFNLEGQIEKGGYLRIAILGKSGFETIEYEH